MSPVARGWLRGRQRVGRRRIAPCGADELGDAVEPLLVEVVDGAVAQEFVCGEECGPHLHGSAACVRRGTGRGQRCGAAILPHRRMQQGRLLLVPRRAGGSMGGRRRGTTTRPTDGSRLGDVGSESSPTLGAGSASIRHGYDGRSHATSGRKILVHPYLARQMSDFMFRKTLEVRTLGCAWRSLPYLSTSNLLA